MKNLKSSLGKIMPGAEQEISQMAEMLGGFMNESFAGDGAFSMVCRMGWLCLMW